jgi:UDP-N-acetylglucosamine--N-acetylmuramyl-(pentapeptide) pyrophosphoryl-undecaprenol N-acetylglucosamine transferase
MTVIALAAGGTAGHIEPAIACAKAIKDKNDSVEVFIIGTEKGLERTLVPQRGIELALIPSTPMPRNFNLSFFTLPFRLFVAMRISQQLLRDRKVDCVVGFGAYVSLPVYLAARKMRIPIIVHEGNKKAGLANRIGSKFAKQVFQMFPGSIKGASTIGMPLRRELSDLNKESTRANARQLLGLKRDLKTVLVFGGSQGAVVINKVLIESLIDLEKMNIQILHSIGNKNKVDSNTEKYDFYHPVSYIEKMELAYAAADLVVSRAGAMTIAEQTILAMPAIYIPFASGNGEQKENVSQLIRDGGGSLILESDLTPRLLVSRIKEILESSTKLAQMSLAAGKHGLRDADQKVAESALALAREHKKI